MYINLPALLLVTGVLLAPAGSGLAADDALRTDVERLAQRRIFFGHQSVGGNILDGLRALARDAGTPMSIADISTAASVPAATLGHAWVGENGKPFLKLEAFEQAMGRQAGVDVALVKFCYLDVTATTDVRALFERYRATVDRLRQQHPRTVFVHVTTPLTQVQKGAKALIKSLLGRAPYGSVENMRREQYNRLLRETYSGREPVFDLARVESTAPDGTLATTEWEGGRWPVLVGSYTDDGHHLNDEGRRRAARALLSVLAAIPPSTGSSH